MKYLLKLFRTILNANLLYKSVQPLKNWNTWNYCVKKCISFQSKKYYYTCQKTQNYSKLFLCYKFLLFLIKAILIFFYASLHEKQYIIFKLCKWKRIYIYIYFKPYIKLNFIAIRKFLLTLRLFPTTIFSFRLQI